VVCKTKDYILLDFSHLSRDLLERRSFPRQRRKSWKLRKKRGKL